MRRPPAAGSAPALRGQAAARSFFLRTYEHLALDFDALALYSLPCDEVSSSRGAGLRIKKAHWRCIRPKRSSDLLRRSQPRKYGKDRLFPAGT